MNRELIISAVVVIIGALFFALSFDFIDTGDEPVGSGKVASGLAIAIMMLGIAIAVTSSGERPGKTHEELPPTSVFLGYVAAGAFCLAIGTIGFMVAVFGVIAMLLFAFGTRRLPKLLLISLLGAVAYYAFFIRALGVRDPRDFLATII